MLHSILAWIGGIAVVFVIGFLGGVHWESKRNQAEVARQVARLETANRATETDKERIAEKLQQSETQIDQWKKDYADALAKRGEAACLLSDDDVRWLQHAPGSRPKPKNK